ncbi:FAD/NAD(P)-binding domain-containing protein [Meredithblackwellia eburnea MCA 4105]
MPIGWLRFSILVTLLAALLHQSIPLGRSILAASPSSRALFSTSSSNMAPQIKNVVVVGGSYVGQATAKELIEALPKPNEREEYRVVVVEKNSHFGHLFAYPRFALTTPGKYEHKAFIPFTNTLPSPHTVVRGAAVSINRDSVTLDRPLPEGGTELPFVAVVLATGTKLSPPGTLPGETKKEGIEWFNVHQKKVEQAKRIVIVGGGAVGVQMACDIPLLFPNAGKEVTLIHSRPNLMSRFHPKIHEIVSKRFEELGVKTVLGSRAKIPAGGWEAVKDGGVVELQDGRKVEGDLIILSTGQTPLSGPIKTLAPSAITESGFIKVKPTFQISATGVEGLENIFAVGDIADSGAPKAARPGAVQAGVVARNIAKLVAGKQEPLETYKPDPAAIHLTLGLIESIIFRNPPSSSLTDPLNTFVGEPVVTFKDDGHEDMNIEGVWKRRAGAGITDYHL